MTCRRWGVVGSVTLVLVVVAMVGVGNGGVSGSVVALAAHWWWLSASQMISPMA